MNTIKRNTPSFKPQLRADAAWALHQILDNGKSSNEVLPIGLSRYESGKDRGWFQECLYGCLRDVPLYQYWTNLLLSKPISEKDKIAERLIMVGLFQLHKMRTPDHAAISETVNAIKIIGKPKFSGLINAVLRRFLRDKIDQQPIEKPHIQYGIPKWLLKQIQSDYPTQWEHIVENSNKRAPIFLRINALAVKPSEYKETLRQSDIQFEDLSATCIKLTQSASIVDIPGFDDGAFSVQDLAAQHAARLLDAQTNDIILDCCAAPGGKTGAIYEQTPTVAKIIAIDNDDIRITRMKENFQRLYETNQVIDVLQDDAAALNNIGHDVFFDRILLDAPCSATGIIRRHPDIKWLRKRADIDALVDLQQKILNQAWQRLKEGGTLLYATCSILRAENVNQIKLFLAENPDAQWLSIHATDTMEDPGWQIFPGESETDGFYYAKLKKNNKQ